jgi:hypothetical protein
MTLPDYDDCLLQDGAGDYAERITATVTPTHEVWLVRTDEEGHGDGLAHLTLTPDGWTTLVELFALRRPDAFARVVAKVEALRAAQPKEEGRR